MKFALSKIKRADLTAHSALWLRSGRGDGNSSYIAADRRRRSGAEDEHGSGGGGNDATIYRTKSNPGPPADPAEIELINTSWEDWRNLQFKNIHTQPVADPVSLFVIENGQRMVDLRRAEGADLTF